MSVFDCGLYGISVLGLAVRRGHRLLPSGWYANKRNEEMTFEHAFAGLATWRFALAGWQGLASVTARDDSEDRICSSRASSLSLHMNIISWSRPRQMKAGNQPCDLPEYLEEVGRGQQLRILLPFLTCPQKIRHSRDAVEVAVSPWWPREVADRPSCCPECACHRSPSSLDHVASGSR